MTFARVASPIPYRTPSRLAAMPPPEYWDEEDEWYSDRYTSGARHVHPPRRARDDAYGRRTTEFLAPEHHTYTTGLHRTRSQGHSPAPNVTIYNTSRMDNESSPNVRTEQRSPAPSPRLAPRGRTRRLADDWALEDELEELKLQVAKQRSRSRSVHYHRDDSPSHEYERWKLQDTERRLKETEDKLEQERREELRDELMKKRAELKYIKDRREREEEEARIKAQEDRLRKDWELKLKKEEMKRIEDQREAEDDKKRIILEEQAKLDRRAKEKEDERKRIITENTLKMEREERERKEARQRAVDAFTREQAEKEKKAKEERDRIVMEYERRKVEDEVKAKKQREELIMQLKIEEEERKRKEQEEWDRFLMKQKKKEEEEKTAKTKKEKELEEEMRKRLAHFGFQDNQIQAMIKPEDAAKLQQGMAPSNPLRLTHQPTYVKVHKEHLSVETLLYYDIPYEIDRVSAR